MTLETQSFTDYMAYVPIANQSAAPSKALLGSGGASSTPGRVRELQLLVTIRSTEELPGRSKIKDITLFASGKRYRLDNKEDTELFPSDDAGMNFVTTNANGLVTEAIEGIGLDLPGVAKWVPMRTDVNP